MINYSTLLRDHVTLRCRSIDRIFLQGYVPRLQTVGEVCTFLRWQRKFPIPSSARHPHMDWGREMAFINHFYFYLWDSEWCAAFWKTNAYAPFPIWLWLNGYEWAKRQLDRAGIDYEALDNGFRSCSNAAGLQKICGRLGPAAVQSFFARWSRRLPSVFTEADRCAGYRYEMAFRQFEVSDTWVFDRPQAGRMWFEGVIRDHLDVGRPDQIALIFQRRVNCRTPGRFRTRVITREFGVSRERIRQLEDQALVKLRRCMKKKEPDFTIVPSRYKPPRKP
jgi:Sigma-70, region 4